MDSPLPASHPEKNGTVKKEFPLYTDWTDLKAGICFVTVKASHIFSALASKKSRRA